MDIKQLLKAIKEGTLEGKMMELMESIDSIEVNDSNLHVAKVVANLVPTVITYFLQSKEASFYASFKCDGNLKTRWWDGRELSSKYAEACNSVYYKQVSIFRELLTKTLSELGISYETEYVESGEFFCASDTFKIYFEIK